MQKIRILFGGPFEVSGNLPLRRQTMVPDERGASKSMEAGREFPKRETYHLCRCGHSNSKPYCDGTHTEIRFVGEEVALKTPYQEQAIRYRGPVVDLLDQENLCAVARFCDRGAQVWGYAESSDPDDIKMAIYEASMCPSGRLTIVKKDGEVLEPAYECEVGLIQDPARNHRGPLFLQGGVTVESADGETYELRNRVTLCRCGESSNMPFCDASHLACPHMEGLDEEPEA